MSYIDEIFRRADIHQIRAFLLDGTEAYATPQPYHEQLTQARREAALVLQKLCPDTRDFNTAMDGLCCYAGKVEAVFMEIGIQVGAILAAQVGRNVKQALEAQQ